MLFKKGLKPKSLDFYNIENKNFVDYNINYQWMLDQLEQQTEITDLEANQSIFVKEKYANQAQIKGASDYRPP